MNTIINLNILLWTFYLLVNVKDVEHKAFLCPPA